MRLTIFAAACTFLLWGTPAFAVDTDRDGIDDTVDNCDLEPNPDQDDTDADGCGNLCDADYDQNGIAGFLDFGMFVGNFGCRTAACERFQHVEPIGGGRAVGFLDYGAFLRLFGGPPGPC